MVKRGVIWRSTTSPAKHIQPALDRERVQLVAVSPGDGVGQAERIQRTLGRGLDHRVEHEVEWRAMRPELTLDHHCDGDGAWPESALRGTLCAVENAMKISPVPSFPTLPVRPNPMSTRRTSLRSCFGCSGRSVVTTAMQEPSLWRPTGAPAICSRCRLPYLVFKQHSDRVPLATHLYYARSSTDLALVVEQLHAGSCADCALGNRAVRRGIKGRHHIGRRDHKRLIRRAGAGEVKAVLAREFGISRQILGRYF